ncbi:MAG: hypothetical protein M1544_02855 [Candidatus Marsarchaeota archaeon]|nr:hypothetical protein [Candidatus Marsarchaeota archaeon]
MNGNKTPKDSVRDSRRYGNTSHNFFFIKPEDNTSAEDLASKLMKMECIKEVNIKSGTLGYNVTAIFSDDSYSKVESKIPKIVGPSYGKFVSAAMIQRVLK